VRRLAAVTVIAALALTSLSGCFLLPQAAEPTPEPSESEQVDDGFAAVGDCWETNFSDMAEWSVWEGDGPVDCDEEHHAYTYWVGEIDADIEEAWVDGSISGELGSAISEQCGPHLRDLGIPDEAARAGEYFFVTAEDDWNDGDQRFRCDVAVSALDSDWTSPELEALPADIDDLVTDIDKHTRSYELCLVGDGYGPYESTEVYYADCAGDYYWRFAGTVEYPSAAGDAYPSGDSLYTFAVEECSTLGLRGDEVVLPYTPSPDGWDSGYRDVSCWASLVAQPSTPV
jgi:hypothetical protein